MKAVLACLIACSSAGHIPAVRFANSAPVHAVDDRLDVPTPPEKRDLLVRVYLYDGAIGRRLERAMELRPDRRALGVNAIDEVPDSTWFTNRIGVRDLSLDDIKTGPTRIDNPELHKPWTIKSAKLGGSEVGFIIADATGQKFLLKFDPAGHPEEETATHIVVDRLLWAFGYNTTEDFIVQFTADDLVLGKDAKLDRDTLMRRLALIEKAPDGKIRGIASHFIAGKLLGGHPAEGVREGDPNDRIPHELRRDLRGFYTVASWVDHVDIQEGNFIDSWVTDPADPKRHYVEHYFIDFGKSMGVMASTGRDPRAGFDYVLDFGAMGTSLLTGGLLERPWEKRESPALRGVGVFDAASFDPGSWKPDWPAYVPFLTADRFDGFWAAKIIMRFTAEQIRAAVDEARYSDPRAAAYVTGTLIARQRAIGAYWFARVNPLDGFTADEDRVCFDDLLLRYRLGSSPQDTSYRVTVFDRDAHRLGRADTHPNADGHACVAVPHGGGDDTYTIVELATHRHDFSGTTYVHLARDPSTHAMRVIGVWRD